MYSISDIIHRNYIVEPLYNKVHIIEGMNQGINEQLGHLTVFKYEFDDCVSKKDC